MPKFRTRRAVKEWVGKRSAAHFGPLTVARRRRRYLPLFLTALVGTRPRLSALHHERHLLFMLNSRHGAPIASAHDPRAITLVQETADAAVAIIDRLADAGAPAISLVGGLAEPLLPWLPPRIRDLVTEPQSDALDGSILMAHRAFFRLDLVRLRAG